MANDQVYELPSHVTIVDAEQVFHDLRDKMETHDNIVVSGEKVEKADLTLLQILTSAHKTAKQKNKRFSVNYPKGGPIDALLNTYGASLPDHA